MYDLAKIKAYVKPVQVARHLGIRTAKSGKNTFIACPAHEKMIGRVDRNLSNCILGDSFENAFCCFSCGARGDLIDLVAYHEGLDRNADFFKILGILADSGNKEDFIEEDTEKYKQAFEETAKKRMKEADEVILTPAEFEVLGITTSPSVNMISECLDEDDIRDGDRAYYQRESAFTIRNNHLITHTVYLDVKKDRFELSECRKEYLDILIKLTKEMITQCEKITAMDTKALINHFGCNCSEYDIACAVDIVKMRQIQLNRILQKLQTKSA